MSLNVLQEDHKLAEEVLYISFNQDSGCFSVGTNTGFRIYASEDFGKLKITHLYGGIGIVEMLYRSNIMALVGGGKTPAFPQMKVIIWDDERGVQLTELSPGDTVRAVKLRRDKIIVVTSSAVCIYGFKKFEVLTKFDTVANPRGIVATSLEDTGAVLAIPSLQPGHVRVVNLDPLESDSRIFKAHNNGLACLALNSNGTFLATASEKGTLIRIFDLQVTPPTLIKEVRRGAREARIYSISFSSCSRFVSVTSSSGTLHVFDTTAASATPGQGSIQDEDSAAETNPKNQKSSLGILSYVSGYFASEWSFASFRGPAVPSIAAFLPTSPASVVVLGADCTYRKLALDTHKGTLDVCELKHFSEGSGSDGGAGSATGGGAGAS
eukprot:RCo007371